MTKRLNIDPITGKKRLEITETSQVKTVIDEDKLLRKKVYLEEAIKNFQAEMDLVDADLATIYAEQP